LLLVTRVAFPFVAVVLRCSFVVVTVVRLFGLRSTFIRCSLRLRYVYVYVYVRCLRYVCCSCSLLLRLRYVCYAFNVPVTLICLRCCRCCCCYVVCSLFIIRLLLLFSRYYVVLFDLICWTYVVRCCLLLIRCVVAFTFVVCYVVAHVGGFAHVDLLLLLLLRCYVGYVVVRFRLFTAFVYVTVTLRCSLLFV